MGDTTKNGRPRSLCIRAQISIPPISPIRQQKPADAHLAGRICRACCSTPEIRLLQPPPLETSTSMHSYRIELAIPTYHTKTGIKFDFRSFLFLLVNRSFNAACSSSMRCLPQLMRWKAVMEKSISSRVETSSREQWTPPARRSSYTAAKNSHQDVLSAAQIEKVLRRDVSNFGS